MLIVLVLLLLIIPRACQGFGGLQGSKLDVPGEPRSEGVPVDRTVAEDTVGETEETTARSRSSDPEDEPEDSDLAQPEEGANQEKGEEDSARGGEVVVALLDVFEDSANTEDTVVSLPAEGSPAETASVSENMDKTSGSQPESVRQTAEVAPVPIEEQQAASDQASVADAVVAQYSVAAQNMVPDQYAFPDQTVAVEQPAYYGAGVAAADTYGPAAAYAGSAVVSSAAPGVQTAYEPAATVSVPAVSSSVSAGGASVSSGGGGAVISAGGITVQAVSP